MAEEVTLEQYTEAILFTILHVYDRAIKENRNLKEIRVELVAQNTVMLMDRFNKELKQA